MITKFGKRFLVSYLAGNADFTSKELALGIGNTAPNSKGNDTKLAFEFYRVPITLGSIDISQTGTDVDGDPVFSYIAIFQGTIPQDVAGVISEVGLYPSGRASQVKYDSKFITSFENNILWEDANGYNPGLRVNSDTFTSKIGENMVFFQSPASTSKEYTVALDNFDLSGYSIKDSLSLAYKKEDNNVSKIRVKFYSSATQYCYVDFTPEATGSTPDKIQSISLESLFSNTSVTPPDFSNLTKLGIEITANSGGTTTLYFDGLRINDEDTFDPSYGLISRSVLSGVDIIYKTSGRQVDIEYKMQLGF
jgi:hypothetical protein